MKSTQKIVSICDGCKKDKPREFSYFTERMWYCEGCQFWKGVKSSAKIVQNGPDWMKAGITLNSKNYETYEPEQDSDIPDREYFYERYTI